MSDGIHFQEADGEGGWVTRASFAELDGNTLFGLVPPRAPERRIVFAGGFSLQQLSGRVAGWSGEVFEIERVLSSRLGDITSSIDLESIDLAELSPGDSVVIDFGVSSATSGSPTLLLVGGSLGSQAGQTRGIESQREPLPSAFTMTQNVPNPFSGTTSISLGIPKLTHVRLDVFDLLGRRLATLVNRELGPGTHAVKWNPNSVEAGIKPGIYVCRMTAEGFRMQRKLVLLP